MTKDYVAQLKPENQRQVQTFIEDVLQRSKLPGISVAMDVNGQTLQAAAGVSDAKLNHPMATAAHFELGCLNKFFTAIVALELVNEKIIELDQVISYYLSELKGESGNKIKVRHLLSHAAGYQGENLADPDVQMDYSYEEFCQSFNQRPTLFEPGSLFDYSHSASVILGKIVVRLTSKKVRDIVQEKIFQPLSIKVIKSTHSNSSGCVRGHRLDIETAQIIQPFPIEWCDFWEDSISGSWMSMVDLVKIGRMLIDESSLISQQTKDLLLGKEVELPGLFVGSQAEHPFFVFGLGCARFPNGSYGVRSNPQGQCCALRFDGDTGIVIAVGINADAAQLRDYTINKLFNAMLPEDAPVISELFPLPEKEVELEELVGVYQGSKHHEFLVSLEDGRLVLRGGHNPGVASNTDVPLFYLQKDEQGNLRAQTPDPNFSIGFFKSLDSERLNLMVGENCFVLCQ